MAGKRVESHEYHAEAYVLAGKLERPVVQEIERHAPVALSGLAASHLTRTIEDTNIEGLVTFKRGHTRVSGSRSLKQNSWVTLSTAILERLNVFDVLTAERLVAQVSSNHPPQDGHFPHVTFLGTQFTNLRISGFPLELTVNLGICGDREHGDISYLDNPTFLKAAQEQTAALASAKGLPDKLKAHYGGKLEQLKALIGKCGKRGKGEVKPSVQCSLVTHIGEVPIPGVKSFGHILVIPDFGTVSFGEIEVTEKMEPNSEQPDNYFKLTNLKMDLGCIGHGRMEGPAGGVNGSTRP